MTYFKIYKSKKEYILRIQSIACRKEVVVTLYGGRDDNDFSFFILESYDDVKIILSLIEFEKIVINNIVGYKDSLSVLEDVINRKKMAMFRLDLICTIFIAYVQASIW